MISQTHSYPHPTTARRGAPALLALILLALSHLPLIAQTVDDAVMIPSRTLFGGYLYTHDSWSQYWEGSLKRANGNIGTLATQTSNISVDYGLTGRLNILATIPYVSTSSSQGVLASQGGWQDITVAAKFRLVTKRVGIGSLSAFAVPFWGAPLTNYTPDFQPLSLGLDSRREGIRSTVNFQSNWGWFVTASGAYTWQEDVHLDRPYYFTNNQLFLTDVVDMPGVVDYGISPGYARKNRMFQFSFRKSITQGGADVGDIRRQDFPFVSNRFISSRVGGTVMYPVPWIPNLAFRFEFSYVVDGRNVGQSTTFTTGLLRTQSLGKRAKRQ